MSKTNEPLLPTVLLTATALVCASLGPASPATLEPTQSPPTNDPRLEMITALPALGPHPSVGDHARLFDRFVGTWDFDCVFYATDGSATRFPGEWIFGWVLDGRALQDVWTDYAKGREPRDRGMGTSMRFYDAKAGLWRVVWVAPVSRNLLILKGGAQGGRILLEGQDSDGSWLRWSFNDIQADSFVWRGESSRDGGKTWRLEEEHRMKRRTGA